ncbi:unnamed protein product [Prunus armeniaca]
MPKLASAWRVAACRRCELSVGLSSCNWASFFDLGSCVEKVFDLPLWSFNLGCPAVTGLEASRPAAGAGDHVWSTDMLEVSDRWVGEVGDGPLVPLTYCDENDIHKKLNLGPNTINVHQALNILARFCGLCWLLSEHQKEADGLPPAEDVERWELHGSDLDDLPVEQEKSSTKLPHSSTSKSSVMGSRLLGMSLWELLLHLPGSSTSSARTVRRSMACRRSGTFCSSIRSNCLKPMIYPVKRMLRSRFDTHVEATEASKHEIVANAYKLGYLDCRNSASPCCPLEHEDEAVEEQIADEAAMEEDNSQGGVADKAKPYAKE